MAEAGDGHEKNNKNKKRTLFLYRRKVVTLQAEDAG
jgi:hypothetical protein